VKGIAKKIRPAFFVTKLGTITGGNSTATKTGNATGGKSAGKVNRKGNSPCYEKGRFRTESLKKDRPQKKQKGSSPAFLHYEEMHQASAPRHFTEGTEKKKGSGFWTEKKKNGAKGNAYVPPKKGPEGVKKKSRACTRKALRRLSQAKRPEYRPQKAVPQTRRDGGASLVMMESSTNHCAKNKSVAPGKKTADPKEKSGKLQGKNDDEKSGGPKGGAKNRKKKRYPYDRTCKKGPSTALETRWRKRKKKKTNRAKVPKPFHHKETAQPRGRALAEGGKKKKILRNPGSLWSPLIWKKHNF